MVKKILAYVGSLGREITNLHEAAYLLALSAGASLIFALIRDRLLAHSLGASAELDVYFAAFRIPDLIYITVASLVSTSILVPFLMESREKGGDELKKSVQSLFGAFSLIILLVSVAAWFMMVPLEKLIFPKLFADGMGDLLVSTSRILLLSPILLGLSSFFASLTQIGNRFLIYAISSPLYNIGIIIGIVFFLPVIGIHGVAYGVIFGAFLLVIAQMPFVFRDGLLPKISLRFEWRRVKTVALLAVPRTVTLSAQQISTVFLVALASFLGAGSISVFTFAMNLQSVPLSIIGASYSSAAFPVLSKLIAQNNREAFLEKMLSAVRHILFWSIPLSVLFIVLRAQIVRTVLGSGEFGWSDTRLTAAALALFVASSVGQSLILLFVRSFYAEGKTSKPLLLNIISMVATVILGFALIKIYNSAPSFALFVQSLMKTGAGDASVLMLPLAYSLGTLLNLILHSRSFSSEFQNFTRPVLRTFFQSFGASVMGGYAAYLSLRVFDDIFDVTLLSGIFLQGLSAGICGIAVMVLILHLLKSRELTVIFETFKHKVWKIDRSSLDRLPS